MSKDLKDLIDSVDSANQAHSDLVNIIKGLKEEVQRLNFTVNEQRKIIENQKSKITSNNIPEDISVLKDLVTEQRQDIIKKDKDIEILQQTITDISSELDNAQKFEDENKELIYANKEIVQLTEENEGYKKQLDDLQITLKELQNGKDIATFDVGEESSELIEAKKLIIKLTEENGINRVQIESSRREIEELKKKDQDSETLKDQYFHELNEVNKILDQLTFDNDQYHEKVKYLQQKLEETVRLQEEQFKEVEKSTGYENTNQSLFDLEVENNELKNIIKTNITVIENLKQRNQDIEAKLELKAQFDDQKLEDLRQQALEKDEKLNTLNLKLQKIETANQQLSDLIVELKVLEDTIEDRVERVTIPKQPVFEKIENANKQLNDLIVELKVLEDSIEEREELATTPKQTIFEKIENANKQLSDSIVELKVLEDTTEDHVDLVTIPKQTISDNFPPILFFKMYKMLSNDYKALVVDQLIENLKSGNRDSRTYAIKVLSVIRGPKVFDKLKELVKDEDWIIKLYLIRALRNFETHESVEILKILQEDGDPDVREAAVEMICKLNLQ